MSYPQHIARVREAAEGDGYFQLLQSKLSEGHAVQSVTVEIEPEREPERYRFLLARLGQLTPLEVPAGGEAIERHLCSRAVKMETKEHEARRCFVRLRQALRTFEGLVSQEELHAALRGFAERSGAGVSLVVARDRWPQVRATGIAVELLARAIERAFDDELTRLAVDVGYSWEEAGVVVDAGLSLWISRT